MLQNIRDTDTYASANFIVLDYGSTDGLEEWIINNFKDRLTSKRLIYYKYSDAKDFHRSHSRNLVFRIAKGEIICNVDADNFIGKGFAEYIHEQFSSDGSIFLTTIDYYKQHKNYQVPSDVYGRICIRKKDFTRIKGYDERMGNYGFEDFDIANRLELSGLRRVLIKNESFLRFIPHTAEERYTLKEIDHKIKGFYIHYRSAWASSLLILFNDYTYCRATLVHNKKRVANNPYRAYSQIRPLFEHSLEENLWKKGSWRHQKDDQYKLILPNGEHEIFQQIDNNLINQYKEIYQRVKDHKLQTQVYIIYLISPNRIIMEENLKNRKIQANPENFGVGILSDTFHASIVNLK